MTEQITPPTGPTAPALDDICLCSTPDDRYTLDTEAGRVVIVHAACGKAPAWAHEEAEAEPLAGDLRHMADQAVPAPAVEKQSPILLRWGLDDVLYGDDDTVTVLLSGPAGEPYWLELDPERAAALREALDAPTTAEEEDQ